MNYMLLVGTTDNSGALVITKRIYEAHRLVKVRWLAGDFANGVDAVIANAGLGAIAGTGLVIGDRTLLTLTNADDDAWYDVSEEGDGIVDQEIKLTVSGGGSGKFGGCIAYFSEIPKTVTELEAGDINLGNVDVLSIAAGENVIGKVGGVSASITPTITVSTTPAYTAGDSIGGKITLANAVRVSGGTALLASVMILDRANQKPAGTILIYNADPTAATLTDNAAVVNSTDDLKVIAAIPVAATDYVTINGKAYANPSFDAKVVKAASGTSLFASFTTTTTPTFAVTTDWQMTFGLAQD